MNQNYKTMWIQLPRDVVFEQLWTRLLVVRVDSKIRDGDSKLVRRAEKIHQDMRG
jgi:hypothetical protein